MGEFTVRDARVGDIEDMISLLGELFSIEADFAVDRERQRRGLELMMDQTSGDRSVQVAEANGRVVGMCTVQLLVSTAEGGLVGLVEDMVVNSRWRGRGIGRRLMAGIEAWAREKGALRLQLLADRDNAPALNFYNRIGWGKTGLICLRRQGWRQPQ